MSLFSKFFSQKPTKDKRLEVPEFTLPSKAGPPSAKFDSANRTNTLIANRYEVVKALKGGMGVVYLCVDHAENNRPIALKTFLPQFLPDRAARDRFLREGTTWVQLGKHPHIVRCYEVIHTGVSPEVFFVIELVAAAESKRDASLRSWLIPGKPLSVEQSLLFTLHIARGMKHATTKIPGLVHRDLKPENVLVGRDGIARVTDFGLANAMQMTEGTLQSANDKESDEASLRRTQLTHGIVGTPLYMAPEQWAGAELDVRADIYAFGFILYEMIAGKFAVLGKNCAELEESHRTGQIGETPSNLPSSLSQLLQQCRAVNRKERYASWSEVETEVVSTYKFVTGTDAPNPIDVLVDTRTERVTMGWSYNAMGISYYDIGKFSVARDYFDKVLAIGQQEEERSLQTAALGNLGNAYLQLGDARGAIGYLEQNLAIAREFGDRDGEGGALGSLGNAYSQLGDARGAIGYYEQTLAIAHEIGERHDEGAALVCLGIAHRQVGDARGAIEYFEQGLAIMREIGDRHGEGQALGNLGTAYRQLDDVRRALGYFEQHLTIARELGDVMGVAIASFNLARLLVQHGQSSEALSYAEYALQVVTKIGHVQKIKEAQQLVARIKAQVP